MNKALQTLIDNMPEKTGKSLEEWKVLLKKKTFAKHSEAVNFLKKDYRVTHGYANTIVLLSKDEKRSDQDLLTNQYRGKESLFPLYEALLERMLSLGNDVVVAPKKGSVSFIRKRQFAFTLIASKTRIDLGLILKGKPVTDRLESSGSYGSMCTHRVRISSIEDIDKELMDWMLEAYQASI